MATAKDELDRLCEGGGYTVAPENMPEDVGPPPKMETGVVPPANGTDWRALTDAGRRLFLSYNKIEGLESVANLDDVICSDWRADSTYRWRAWQNYVPVAIMRLWAIMGNEARVAAYAVARAAQRDEWRRHGQQIEDAMKKQWEEQRETADVTTRPR